MSEKIVNDLYKFIKADVTMEKLVESNKIAYPTEGVEITDESMLLEFAAMVKDGAFMEEHINEVAPEGWEPTVKAMKKHKDIKSPWALAWWMKEKGYKPHAKEGKLPDDPSQIKAPDKEIQLLSEGEKKEKEKKDKEKGSETPPAPVTDKNRETKIEKEMHVATPDVDKKSDFEVAAGVKKDKKADEGKLPDDPSIVKDPQGDIQKLAEMEKPFTTVSDEEAAKVIVGKMPGSRYEKNKEGGFVVYVKEEKTSEPKDKKVTDTVPEVKAEKGVDKLTNEATPAPVEVKKEEPVAEEKTSEPKDKKVTDTVPEVKAEKGVDKLTNEVVGEARGEGIGVGGPRQGDGGTDTCICPKCGETVVHTRGVPCNTVKCSKCGTQMTGKAIEEVELTDEQTQDIAERLFVVEFLEKKKKITEKQKSFIEETKKIKMSSDMNKQKIGKALDQLKAHKGKKS